MNKIKVSQKTYSNRKFLLFKIIGNGDFIGDHLLKLPGIKWSEKKECYYMERSRNDIGRIFRHLKGTGYYFDYSNVKAEPRKSSKQSGSKSKYTSKKLLPPLNSSAQDHVNNFERWLTQKRYSKNTISSYVNLISVLFRYYNNMKVEDIGIGEIERYNHDYIIANKYSCTFQNQTISAVKLFYLKMLKIKVEFELLERPRKAKPLPKVISKEHVQQLLSSIKNLKHKVALTTIYSLGLRRSELINLKLSDIYLDRSVVIIRNAKGQKDRLLPLPSKLKSLIIKYYNSYTPSVYLLESNKEGERYSKTSLRNIFNDNLNKIIKNHTFTLHCLRHSFATHMHESGIDIRNIQELMGHKSSKTTDMYTHVSLRNLKSLINPIDDLDI